ncbi:MAG: type II toxin-antitoxin system RelE/ParE family toxin [Chitinophagaceae bacterium]|nr:type II toxin-antitoxin system RelE/ParE family toxin [Chitinophagaceae bacterium]
MKENFKRNIFFYKHYYLDFLNKQNLIVQKKINWTIELIMNLERIPSKYFNHMENTDGLYEIRVEVGSNISRVFSFFDEGNLVILLNGFQKKSQKTPGNEIELAEKLKKEYFNEKDNQ